MCEWSMNWKRGEWVVGIDNLSVGGSSVGSREWVVVVWVVVEIRE